MTGKNIHYVASALCTWGVVEYAHIICLVEYVHSIGLVEYVHSNGLVEYVHNIGLVEKTQHQTQLSKSCYTGATEILSFWLGNR